MSKVYHYAIYEAATGKVLRAGRSTNPKVTEAQVLAGGEALHEGQIDPGTTYLPAGVPEPKQTETPAVTKQQVKTFAGRMLSYTDWYVTRRADTGEAMPEEIAAYRQAVRDASDAIEAMNPIPADFRDPKYWPEPKD